MAEREGTWRAGLCWDLADGLIKWINFSRTLPPSAVFPVIVGDVKCPAHHVAVCVENIWYLDANGISTKEELLRYWQNEEGLEEPFIAPYDEQLLTEQGILRDARMITRLADCFLSVFGRFSPAFLHDSKQS
jgi:hypothetical protein